MAQLVTSGSLWDPTRYDGAGGATDRRSVRQWQCFCSQVYTAKIWALLGAVLGAKGGCRFAFGVGFRSAALGADTLAPCEIRQEWRGERLVAVRVNITTFRCSHLAIHAVNRPAPRGPPIHTAHSHRVPVLWDVARAIINVFCDAKSQFLIITVRALSADGVICSR